jgi:hypothetical protein
MNPQTVAMRFLRSCFCQGLPDRLVGWHVEWHVGWALRDQRTIADARRCAERSQIAIDISLQSRTDDFIRSGEIAMNPQTMAMQFLRSCFCQGLPDRL